MTISPPNPIGRAPRLKRRLQTNAYYYPAFLFVCAATLSLFAWFGDIKPLPMLIWMTIASVCCIGTYLTADGYLVLRDIAWLWKRLGKDGFKRSDEELAAARQMLSEYPTPNWYANRRVARDFFSGALFLSSWGFAAYAARAFRPNDVDQTTLALLLFLFPLIIFSVVVIPRLPLEYHMTGAVLTWVAVMAAAVIILSPLYVPIWTSALTGALLGFAYACAYAVRILWASESVYKQVLIESCERMLTMRGQLSDDELRKVVRLIGHNLRFHRVFLLQTTSDGKELEITHSNDPWTSLIGERIPINSSITGRAFRDEQTVAWNNVDACPYYHRDESLREIRAEVAVPVKHQGKVYNILDIESDVSDVFTERDIKDLEALGLILGAAMAASGQHKVIEAAQDLWRTLEEETRNDFPDDKSAFAHIAGFASDALEAELIIYLPLALSGLPVRKPYVYDEHGAMVAAEAPGVDPESPLLELINTWREVFEEETGTESQLVQVLETMVGTPLDKGSIGSTCFIPVGRRGERLGVLFFVFRHPRRFDPLSQFTLLNLSQALAELAAEIRYRDIFSRSFGRPELNIHQLLNNHGFKEGGIGHTADRMLRENGDPTHQTLFCPLRSLIRDVDALFRDISAIEASLSPSFWGQSLRQALDNFGANLPARDGQPKPILTHEVDKEIDRESPWIRLALYRVITEATVNAIKYGDAQKIQANVKRGAKLIDVEILNDGLPLPDDAEQRRSKRGIYWLLDECEQSLAAVGRIRPLSEGTQVTLSIPVLNRQVD